MRKGRALTEQDGEEDEFEKERGQDKQTLEEKRDERKKKEKEHKKR